MITTYMMNKELMHVRNLGTYDPPLYTYLCLSCADNFDESWGVGADGSMDQNQVKEPSSDTGYQRVRLPNGQGVWKISDNSPIVVTNVNRIAFNEFSTQAGIARYIFEVAERRTSYGSGDVPIGEQKLDYIMSFARLEPEVTLYKGMTVFFNPGDIQFTRTNIQ